MNYEEIIEPIIGEKVDSELYEEIKEELEKSNNRILGLEDDLEETKNDLKAVIETIVEYGNKYEFSKAYLKLVEFLKYRSLI